MDRPLWDRFSRLFITVLSAVQNETLYHSGSSHAPLSIDATNPPSRNKFPSSTNITAAPMGSSEEQEEGAEAFSVPGWVYILMTSLYACIFVLGISGNLLVILVIAKDRRMRTTANFYLISLSVADLMIIAFCLPVAVYELHAEEVWSLGPVLCKLAPLLQYLSTNASISTMVAISIERYLVVCRPLQIRTYCTTGRACGLILVLWLFSLACSSPLLQFTAHVEDYHHRLQTAVYVCYINHFENEGYFYFHQACFYLLPGLLLSLLYLQIVRTLREFKSERFGHSPDSRRIAGPGSKSQADTKQLIFMLSAVVISYFVCLLPYNCVTFLSLVSHRTLVALGPIGYNVFLAVSRIMFFVNSCTNPILYNALSGKFRDAFKKFFCPKRFKNRGSDSRTMSQRSRGGGADEDQLLNRRIRANAENARLENGASSKSTRGITSGSGLRRTWSGSAELEKESFTGMHRSEHALAARQHSCGSKLNRMGFSQDQRSSIRKTPVTNCSSEAEL